jgi:hypothetical protein
VHRHQNFVISCLKSLGSDRAPLKVGHYPVPFAQAASDILFDNGPVARLLARLSRLSRLEAVL